MLGEKIREARINKGLTQEDVVTKAKELYGDKQKTFNAKQLWNWEDNRYMPNLKNLKILSEILEVSPNYLLSSDNEIEKAYYEGFKIGNSIEYKEHYQLDIIHITEANIEKRLEIIAKICSMNELAIPDIITSSISNTNFADILISFVMGLNNGLQKSKYSGEEVLEQ